MIIIKIDFFYFYDYNNYVIYRCNWEFYNICNNIIFITISIIKNIFIINKNNGNYRFFCRYYINEYYK
jgi:hypothetical protein